jgi:predicted MFS family arabinose efflux permease
MFNLVSGVAMLVASVVAGWAWDSLGSAATFWIGAIFAAACLAVLARPSSAPPHA